jgi:molybdenum cofactor cytidylyltransferase
MSKSIQHCGVLIIAAGQSKRLGQPKQLLQFEGKSLINRLIEIVKEAIDFPITVVLGSASEKIKEQLTESNIKLVQNETWEEGMASSIRVGINSIVKADKNIDGVMILVCDQPLITVKSIRELVELQQSTLKPISACYYANIIGTPAIFHKTVFDDLSKLQGDMGAKKIIQSWGEEVAKLHFEEAVFDIDTEEDYHKLIKN